MDATSRRSPIAPVPPGPTGLLGDLVVQACRASGLTWAEIGRRAGVDDSALRRWRRGERDLGLSSVEQVLLVVAREIGVPGSGGQGRHPGRPA